MEDEDYWNDSKAKANVFDDDFGYKKVRLYDYY